MFLAEILSLAAAACIALSGMLIGELKGRVDVLRLARWQLCAAFAMTGAASLVFGGWQAIGAREAGLLALSALFGIIIASTAYYAAIYAAGPTFAQESPDAVNYGDGEIQVTLREVLIREENVPGMFRWLESRQAQDFGQKKLVVNQHVGPGGGPIQVAVATTDQLRELLGDPDYREKMLAVVNELPMIETTATERD